MKIVKVESVSASVPVSHLKPGQACILGGATYLKIDKTLIAANLSLKWKSGCCVLCNLESGSLATVPAKTKVVACIAGVRVCPITTTSEREQVIREWPI